MYTPKHTLLSAAQQLLDIVLMLSALALSLWLGSLPPTQRLALGDFLQLRFKAVNFLLLLLFSLIWHLILISMGLYHASRIERERGEWRDIIKAVLIGSMVLLVVTEVFQRDHVSRTAVVLFAGFAGLFTWVGHAVVRAVLGRMRRHNRNLRYLLLVGSNQRVQDFACRIIAKPQLGYRIVGYLDELLNGQSYHKMLSSHKYLGTLDDFDAVIDQEEVDEVVISLPIRSCYEQIKRLVEACEEQGIRVHLLSDFFQLKMARAYAIEFDGVPLLTMATGTFAVWPSSVKRVFDVVVGTALVVTLTPLFLLIALLIKLTSPHGPVLFRQTRIGHNRRRFEMLKFRTMVPDAERLQAALEELNEAQGPVFKIKNDPRVLPLGRLLRRTSLDELPQLFNVITGDMSLVGPRPLPLRDVRRFEEPWLKRRFSVKPGITCLWQINGRCETNFDTWIAQDLEYIDHWSFGLDLKILAKTIPAVLRGTGAH